MILAHILYSLIVLTLVLVFDVLHTLAINHLPGAHRRRQAKFTDLGNLLAVVFVILMFSIPAYWLVELAAHLLY